MYVIFKNQLLKNNDAIHVWLLHDALDPVPAMMNKYSRLSNLLFSV
jgi:hypothetical protein